MRAVCFLCGWIMCFAFLVPYLSYFSSGSSIGGEGLSGFDLLAAALGGVLGCLGMLLEFCR